jgi:hypothetical protein
VVASHRCLRGQTDRKIKTELSDVIGVYVGKVSTIFEFFLTGFVSVSELTLVQVELGVEFDSESNGDIFRLSCPSKTGTSAPNTDFCRYFCKVFDIRIR